MIINNLITAFGHVLNPISLLAMLAGVIIGIIIGALPGLSATMGVALLLPLTFGMDPGIGLPMLVALYCGAMYGGSISAILLHTPGTPAAAATCLDGYPMAQKGQAGKAIGFSLVASFIGGIFSAFALLFIAPALSKVSLLFGPPEYFSLAILGLTLIATLTQGDWIKGLLAGFLGLLVAMVGLDIVTGQSRFAFGQVELLSGIPLVIALIGMFSISQALLLIEKKIEGALEAKKVSGKIFPTFKELKPLWFTIIRSSIIGTWVGMVPGTGGDLATWVGYNEAKRSSKNPELFGTGIPEGVVASEAANNAVTGGSLIPLMVLGIPGSSVTAVLLGGFLVHGLRPGPKFMTEYGDLSFTIILSLFIINLIMLGSGLFFGKMGVLITKIRDDYLAPVIITLSIIGSYAINNSMFDVGLMFVFGLLGYVMVKYNIPRAPMVLGLILGPLAETGLQQSLLISSGNWMIFLNKPLSLGLLVIAFISLTSAIYKDAKRIKKTNQLRKLEAEESNIIDSE